MGGRTELRLGRSIPQTRTRLRTARHYTQRISLCRLRLPHHRKHIQTTRINFITGSKRRPMRGTAKRGDVGSYEMATKANPSRRIGAKLGS